MRDKKKNQREIIHALTMVLQIGLAMLTCMGMSMAIGYYIDRLFGTRYWLIIMLFIGILAAIRSLFILTERYFKKPESSYVKEKDGETHGDSQD
ncbi:MAG: AtpZ/AtpI family protein [Lachnospiraceae bacterium]|nr:AtpZ/AtpI family protein [Lachnospiraceae bacterium]